MKVRNTALALLVFLPSLVAAPARADQSLGAFKSELLGRIDAFKSTEAAELETLPSVASKVLSDIASSEEYQRCISPRGAIQHVDLIGRVKTCHALHQRLDSFADYAYFTSLSTPESVIPVMVFRNDQTNLFRRGQADEIYVELEQIHDEVHAAFRTAFQEESLTAWNVCQKERFSKVLSCYTEHLRQALGRRLPLVAEQMKPKLAASVEVRRGLVRGYQESVPGPRKIEISFDDLVHQGLLVKCVDCPPGAKVVFDAKESKLSTAGAPTGTAAASAGQPRLLSATPISN